jgi:hypothetical protein
MNTRDTATLVLLQEVVIRQLSTQKNATREQAKEAFDQVGVRDIGVISGEQIGSVQLTKGATRASVTDMDALLKWAQVNAPDQVVTVPVLRPAYLTALLTGAKAEGVAVTKDGELIPGIDVTQSDPSLMVKPSEDAAEILAREFAAGRLTFADLTAPQAIEAT